MSRAEFTMPYTTASAFFEALWDAGIRYCFVNLGSDHPSILDAITYGQREFKERFPRIITCPHEMVAMSMADGYARLTGQPQAVIVHVDVGTQALGQAFHNASSGRAPVLVFAGSAPYTQEGEMKGSRTEFIHWLQDIPDQRAIVSQYCRYTAEIKTGRNIKQMVNRALQFATSDPKGPVYLMCPREVIEETIEPYQIIQNQWAPITSGALPEQAVEDIASALVHAEKPIIVIGFVGRQHAAVKDLVRLADLVKGVKVYDSGMCDMSFPADHRAWTTPTTGARASIQAADMILVLDADVPWIPASTKPRDDAKIIHVDVDPLKSQMQLFYIPATARYRASTSTALSQLVKYISNNTQLCNLLNSPDHQSRWEALGKLHSDNLSTIASRATTPPPDHPINISYLSSVLRTLLPPSTIFASEAVTNHVKMADQLQATHPGTFLTKGGSGLGWNGGAALGIHLAATDISFCPGAPSENSTSERPTSEGPTSEKPPEKPFVAMITGDGSYMFSAPSSAAWVAAKYSIPTLTIVLNNGGWKAPRLSAMAVDPQGLAQGATDEELGIGFGPRCPRYVGIAVAGSDGWCWGRKVERAEELVEAVREGVRVVREEGRGVVLDVVIE